MERDSASSDGAAAPGAVPDAVVADPTPPPKIYRRLLRNASSYASFQLPNGQSKGGWLRSGRPLVCMGVMAVCTLVLIVEIGANGWKLEEFKDNPTFGPSVDTLLSLGAKRTDLIVDQGQWYRLFAPIFLHSGIIHLVFNMLGLWSIGFPLERQFGSLAMAYIFLLSGFMGVIISAIFAPTMVGVGASGGIFGIFGSAWAELFQNWSLYQGQAWKSLVQLVIATAFNLAIGLMPFLDNFAHLGGFFTGLVCGLGVLVSDRYSRFGELKERKTYQVVLQVFSVVVTPIMVVVALFVLYFGFGDEDPEEWCSFCRYLTCVPFPPGENKWWECDECSDSGVRASWFAANSTLTLRCPTDGSWQSKLGVTIEPSSSDVIGICRDLCLKS